MENEISNGGEFRCYGPPGTGKTTWLAKQIRRGAMKYGPSDILVTSFTKASAVELAGRNLPIDRNNVGTLHSICYRALNQPEIAELHIGEWNNTQGENSDYLMSGDTKMSLDDPEEINTKQFGDQVLMNVQKLRGKCIPVEAWPLMERGFNERWKRWKENQGYVDFVDMLEMGLNDFSHAPGSPRVIFCDEAQDMNPLMLNLIRKWGSHESVDFFIIAGDDDQCIYRFMGSDPDAFLNPALPADREKILPLSYRVPRLIQEFSQKIISRVERRKDKQYQPRDIDGAINLLPSTHTFRNPGALVRDAEQYLEDGKTVMFLTTCSYMLDELKVYLRDCGIPFHNPYRRRNHGWNPLCPSRGVSSSEKLLAFLRPEPEVWGDLAGPWRREDCEKWLKVINASGAELKRGIKNGMLDFFPTPNSPVPPSAIFKNDSRSLVETFVFGDLRERLEWFERNLMKSAEAGMGFPLAVAKKYGAEKLRAEPQIILGTIHSVKGGEADVVYLFPDLSSAGMEQWQSMDRADMDGILRLFYVGATRTKEVLNLCSPISPRAFFKFQV